MPPRTPHTPAAKHRMRLAKLGKSRTPAARKAISEGIKKHWEIRKAKQKEKEDV